MLVSLAHTTQHTPEEKQQLTDIEAASYLNISPAKLRRWRLGSYEVEKNGDLGPRWIRIGSAIRYPLSELKEYVKSRPGGGTLTEVA